MTDSYKQLADKESKVIFGGRLGEYKYYDMDQVIAAAMQVGVLNVLSFYGDEKIIPRTIFE